MVVTVRHRRAFGHLALAVRQHEIDVVSVCLQRERVPVQMACVDPERQRTRGERRPEGELDHRADKRNRGSQISHPGRLQESTGSRAPVGEISVPYAFGRATA